MKNFSGYQDRKTYIQECRHHCSAKKKKKKIWIEKPLSPFTYISL